jgi:predicted RNase H-like HicB family nuclease
MKKIDVIIEKGEKEFWGRIEGYDFLPVTVAKNIAEVLDNLKMLIADYIENEGQNDRQWKNFGADKIEFNLHYDLRAFFDEYDFLSVSGIAQKAKINRSLLGQYVKGIKHPSTRQAKKVEAAVHELAQKMNRISLVGSTLERR